MDYKQTIIDGSGGSVVWLVALVGRLVGWLVRFGLPVGRLVGLVWLGWLVGWLVGLVSWLVGLVRLVGWFGRLVGLVRLVRSVGWSGSVG